MADTTALKNRIRAAIKANDNQEITGPVLQQTLLDIVDELGDRIIDKYTLIGIAVPTTIPPSDLTEYSRVFYLTAQNGIYANLGSIEVSNEIAIIKYNGTSWSKDTIITIDAETTAGSKNLIESGGVDKSVGIETFEIIKYKGCYALQNGQLVYNNSENWRNRVLNVSTFRKISANLISTVSTGVGGTFIPCICFLTGKDISTYISNSEVYGDIDIANVNFRRYIGTVDIPVNAKYVLLQSNRTLENLPTTIKFDYGATGMFKNISRLFYDKVNGCSISPVGASAVSQSLYIKGLWCSLDKKYRDYSVKIIQCGYGTSGARTAFFFNTCLYDGTDNYKCKPRFKEYSSIPSVNVRYCFDIELNGVIVGAISFVYDYENIQDSTKPVLLNSLDYNSTYIALDMLDTEREYSEELPIDKLDYKQGNYRIIDGELTFTESPNWMSAIIPTDRLEFVKTIATSSEASTTVPAILYLTNSEPVTSNVISGTEEYGTEDTESTVFKVFNSYPTIPANATYAIINLSTYWAVGGEKVIYLEPLSDFIRRAAIKMLSSNKIDDLEERVSVIEQELPTSPKIFIVRQTNTGQNEYATIAAALDVANDGDIIKILSGVYEEYHLDIKKGMTLIGIGDVEIRGYLPPETSPTTILEYSTLECKNGATIENIKVTAKNLRYPIHADGSNGRASWKISHCIFEHYGNNEAYQYQIEHSGSVSILVSACSAFGGGLHGGDVVECFDSKFISTGRGFSCHNNDGTDFITWGACHVTLDSCELISRGIDRDGDIVNLLAPLFVQSLNCPISGCDIVVKNCIINGYMVFQNQQDGGDGWSFALKVFNSGHLKTAFSKYGGGLIPLDEGSQISLYQEHYDKYPLTDDQNAFVNRGLSTIPIGSAVKKTANGGVALYDNTGDDFFGVALEEILPNEVGNVWYKGYISRIYLSGLRTTTINEGQSIYVLSDGTFALSGTKKCFDVVDNENAKFL